jgi:hypothetical protein
MERWKYSVEKHRLRVAILPRPKYQDPDTLKAKYRRLRLDDILKQSIRTAAQNFRIISQNFRILARHGMTN